MTDSKTPDDSVETKRICADCIGEPYLKAAIVARAEIATCSYCEDEGPTETIEDLADRVELAFEGHFRLTSTEPDGFEYMMLKDRESSYEWNRHGVPVADVIAEAAEIEEGPAEDVRAILDERTSSHDPDEGWEESPFDSEAHYEPARLSDAELQMEWDDFERSLKTEARYFSRSAEKILAATFHGIDGLRDRDGRPALVEIGPGKAIDALFRARVFQADEKLKAALRQPEKDLGPPPFAFALGLRMNSRGISVFYGTNTPETALAEVRPPVGSQVVVGRFPLLRPLRLLDLTVLQDIYVTGSYFDTEFIGKRKHAMFLEHLCERITMPIMPDDEAIEYLPTQVIADYLASMDAPAIDGIIYPSAQASPGQLNMVLFHKAARVQPSDLPEGSKVDVSLQSNSEDGPEPDYTIFVTPPKSAPTKPSAAESSWDIWTPDREHADARVPALRLDTTTLVVHRITAIQVISDVHPISHHVLPPRLDFVPHAGDEEPDDPF
ncbi:RES family NAD+ phosphorylase [Corallococcus exiguus]|uniref:RES domain-containing protein n=1 Tax=Corallococcus exiguus TaxID=83462 RepID=UPI0010DFBFD9|nr:RES domain-containing protein [Corallococcus exiguus]NRD63000.1 RES family NAD+ phosphorylase [Corallococcus exiguus]RYZ37283.1 MAG: RES domain-containing protein [Myxococcaceae bacterium]